jgi:hypothetical protein
MCYVLVHGLMSVADIGWAEARGLAGWLAGRRGGKARQGKARQGKVLL